MCSGRAVDFFRPEATLRSVASGLQKPPQGNANVAFTTNVNKCNT